MRTHSRELLKACAVAFPLAALLYWGSRTAGAAYYDEFNTLRAMSGSTLAFVLGVNSLEQMYLRTRTGGQTVLISTQGMVNVVGAGDGLNSPFRVSTSANSTSEMCMAGAFETLPTSGYKRGCLAYLKGTTHKLYVSTNDVDETGDWAVLH